MKNILITGASSGLGEEFALQYATTNTTLYLCGRDLQRLNHVADICRKKGAIVMPQCLDVTDKNAMNDWITGICANAALDVVIANAGISGGFSNDNPSDIAKDATIFDVNIMGVLNTLIPSVSKMTTLRRGHIVIISSMAGIIPMPSAPAYSASKAAVRYYGEALRHKLAGYGVSVTVICPGFIKSRMTDANDFPMPFLMSTEKAVTHMRQCIEKGHSRVDFPWQISIPLKFLSLLPTALTSLFFAALPDKKTLPND